MDGLRELCPWRFVFLVRFVGFLSGEKAVSVATRSRPKAVGEAAESGRWRKFGTTYDSGGMLEMKLFFDGVGDGN